MILGDHTVTILRAGTTQNEYGNDVRDWNNASKSKPVTGCNVQPVVGVEQTVGRDTVVSRWQLFAPDGTDVEATDRVEFDGETYDVDGEPQRWDFAGLAHLTCLLRKGD